MLCFSFTVNVDKTQECLEFLDCNIYIVFYLDNILQTLNLFLFSLQSNSYVPDSNFCGSGIPVNLAMYNETVGPSATPMYTVEDYKITAITAQNINSYTVLYMGTDQGTLKKVSWMVGNYKRD